MFPSLRASIQRNSPIWFTSRSHVPTRLLSELSPSKRRKNQVTPISSSMAVGAWFITCREALLLMPIWEHRWQAVANANLTSVLPTEKCRNRPRRPRKLMATRHRQMSLAAVSATERRGRAGRERSADRVGGQGASGRHRPLDFIVDQQRYRRRPRDDERSRGLASKSNFGTL